MQLRYMGFVQEQNIREYKFDGLAQGEITRHFVVAADLGLFAQHRVGIQEGPSLCLQKLSSDLEIPEQLQHRLTSDDLLAYVSARTLAAERKAAGRKARAE